MKQFHFSKNKYGVELLMDIGTNKDIQNYFFEPTLHCTNFYEIVFFKKGNGYLELDHQRINIEDHVIIFISPFQKRKWFVQSAKLDCMFLFFEDGFLSHFFSDKLFTYRLQYFYNKVSPLHIKADSTLWEKVAGILIDLLAEVKAFKSDSEHITRALLYFVLIKLNRVYAEKHKLSTETVSNTVAFMFKELLQKHLFMHRDINFYAEQLGVSRVTLNKSIKQQYGITVSSMIDEFLLFEIKTMLLHTNLSIKEITNQLHFSEPNHLSRFFKRETGLTPKKFKMSYQR